MRTCTLVSFVVMLGFGVIGPPLPLFATESGAGNAAVGAAISAFAVVRCATAGVNSRFTQRFGQRRVIEWSLWMQGTAVIAARLAPDFTLLVALRAIGGTGRSAFAIAAWHRCCGWRRPTRAATP
ncbi:MFS transporter [Streptomyces carpinensis]|uniref:MFS transporter n=1 Tax=Streptomyces carpinensis TaxID=66369 RepID=UPI001180B121|nr:MFS transporter [Streptomyces carpinensis]